jgi:hypothetical protein
MLKSKYIYNIRSIKSNRKLKEKLKLSQIQNKNSRRINRNKRTEKIANFYLK